MLKRDIVRRCRKLDVTLVGFAGVEQWDYPPFEPWVPPEFRPRAIYPEAKTVIVLGMPVSLPIVETAPSIYYHELYKTVNLLLDINGYRIASFLNTRGFPSIWVPRDGYGNIRVLLEHPVAFFSHRHAAYLAGLGTFGVNNVLLTEEFGPRVRFVSIFTSAEIPHGTPRNKQLCTNCMRCVKTCPVNAIPEGGYPEGLTNKIACARRSEGLSRRYMSPCGMCIRICPVGNDRKMYGREDMKIYSEENPDNEQLHRAWHHVRSDGGIPEGDSDEPRHI